MNMNGNYKSIQYLAWDVTEEVYRADAATSYSMLSAFAREGASVIPHLKDKKDAEALRFGSLVDCLITEPETLNDRFLIADFSKISDAIYTIVNRVWDITEGKIVNIDNVSDSVLSTAIIESNYQPNWKLETRIKKVREDGKAYYSLLSLKGDKVLMSSSDFNLAQECVQALKTNPFTRRYFADNPFEPWVEGHFQLKFKLENNSNSKYNIRCMFDRMIVDHKKKTIQPIDIKTTGKPEETFEDSFITWRYDLQATMYSYILRKICDKDEYFKDFTILPFMFICINRFQKTPLCWEFDTNLLIKNRKDKSGKVYKSWLQLLQEMAWHIENQRYDYSYESYMLKGVRKLNCLTII